MIQYIWFMSMQRAVDRLTKYIYINCRIFAYTICQLFHQTPISVYFIPDFKPCCMIRVDRNNFLSNNKSQSLQVEHYFLLKSIFHLLLNSSNHFVLQKIFPMKDEFFPNHPQIHGRWIGTPSGWRRTPDKGNNLTVSVP